MGLLVRLLMRGLRLARRPRVRLCLLGCGRSADLLLRRCSVLSSPGRLDGHWLSGLLLSPGGLRWMLLHASWGRL